MITKADIEFNIASINAIFLDYIEYIDSINFTDSDEKKYTTSETLINNVKKATYNSIQYLQKVKKDSLNEFTLTTKQDTTLFNLCFDIYSVVNDENFDSLIKANDLETINRTDIDPNSPIIKRGTKIIYYK